MDFVNESERAAGWTMGFESDGHELIVVAVKATYALPLHGEDSRLLEEQVALVESDVFTGAPGTSAPLYESDYAHRKPHCDVLLNGSAYAPGGRPARHVDVGLKVGALTKLFRVTGPRLWHGRFFGTVAGEPEWFTRMPFDYGNAYGGVDMRPDDPDSIKTYLTNPVGRGFAPYKDALDGVPMPNTEEIGRPVSEPGDTTYRPMSFGPVGRSWTPRAQLAGTYDQAWLDSRAPFWPTDFDHRYFQAAPADQWIPHPRGGEEVILKNLSPGGQVGFRLPDLTLPVLIIPFRGRDVELNAVVDTLLIEPDLERFSLTWRATYCPPRSCFDVMRIVAGKTSRGWRGTRRPDGKVHYPHLGDLVRSRKGR